MHRYGVRVKNLIKKYGTADPLVVADALGIIIFPADLPAGVNGMWKRVLRVKQITYSNKLVEDWQVKAVVGHELGHIMLHPQYHHFCTEGRTYYASAKHEAEADEMAVAMCLASTNIEEEYLRDFLQNGWRKSP